MSGYFYSYQITFDTFTLSKPDFQSDVFVITLNDDLITQCIKQVSGVAENLVWSLSVDKSDNILLAIDNILGNDETNFDGVFTSTESSMFAVIGNSDFFDDFETGAKTFHVKLGKDILKCSTETITLDAGDYCFATYTWSNGAHHRYLTTKEPGEYWVKVQWNGVEATDTVIITNYPSAEVNLGADKEICNGSSVEFDVTQSFSAAYKWSDGLESPVRMVTSSGLYWVRVQTQCETVADSVVITVKPRLHDTIICQATLVTIGQEVPGGEFYRWNDDSTLPTLDVSASGTYEQIVWNSCEEVKDKISITFIDADDFFVPNVVTDDGNLRNDKFILPSSSGPTSLPIYNRWGTSVFSSPSYQNNWPLNSELAGVYFYVMKDQCHGEFRGNIHVLR